MSGLLLEIANGPRCPKCQCDGFDDWWHDKSCRQGFGIIEITAKLTCHGCGADFEIERYYDGETHSRIESPSRTEAAE